MIKKNIFRFSFHSFVTRTHTLSYFHTYLHENETTIYLCNTRTDLEREKLYRHAYTSGGRIIFSRSERSPSSRVTREMARRSAAIEKKKNKLKDQRGENRRRISRYRRRNATAICRRVFEALSRTFEAPFVPIEKKKTKKKTGVKTEYKRSNSPFLSLSLSYRELD